ncbi:MAG: hypothetical protein DHS20C09_09400 [marine bacterium B5-7]|nr:MAG: hypothetical protein DHS20C09_09400 [marine bacterium B5-7]
MNIINKIKASLFPTDKKTSASNAPLEMTMSERERNIFDESHLRLQKLYEKWICKDKWLLQKEGIPLLFGISPNSDESSHDVLLKIEEQWEHAQECVNKKLLSVVNIENSADKWEVLPIDLYRWAMVSRISVPDEFSALIAFVIQTVKPEQSAHIQTVVEQDAVLQKHREIIMGAATSLLVNANEQCQNDKGNISAINISRLIMENKQEWFGQDEPLLDQSGMAELIDNYIKLTSPVI